MVGRVVSCRPLLVNKRRLPPPKALEIATLISFQPNHPTINPPKLKGRFSQSWEISAGALPCLLPTARMVLPVKAIAWRIERAGSACVDLPVSKDDVGFLIIGRVSGEKP